MKKLTHRQQIRTTMDKYEPEIIVCSVEGCVRDRGGDPSLAYEKEIQRAEDCGTAAQTVFSNQSPACLTADYPGKAEAHAAKRAAYAAAVLIENGELVEIEGRVYKARYTRRDCCDPVIFEEQK
jgi:hypothetical protein